MKSAFELPVLGIHAAVVAQSFHDLVTSVMAWSSEELREVLGRIAQSGHVALDTGNCLNATPVNLTTHWLAMIQPIADFTKDERERQYILSRVLLAIRAESYRRFEPPSTTTVPKAA